MKLPACISKALDATAAGLARVFLFRRSRPNPNTLAELGVYRTHGIEALFGVRPGEPDVELAERRPMRGMLCTDLAFASPHVPLSEPFRRLSDGAYQPNARVQGRWLRHPDGQRRPTLIFLHSWMQPCTWLEDVLVLPRIARALDVDIVRFELPYHGSRKPDGSRFHGEYFWTADLVRTIEAMRQSVLDARALVRFLERAAPGPVGVMGVSLGGMVALALSCFEERLAFSIPVAAHLDLAGVLADASLLKPMRVELASHGWAPRDVDDFSRSLGLSELTPSIPTERMLFIAGKHDRLLSAHRTEELWARWDRPPIHWLDSGHLGIFTHMGESLDVSRDFLAGLGLVPERAVAEAPPPLLVPAT